MLNAFTSSFGGWLVHPLLAAAGVILVSSPIIIHLLNRRPKPVDWAAMDFLLEAYKRNRRRIRMEDLLLLLLRCLAMILLGLMVARPFLPVRYTAGLFDSVRFERIVLLDDSPSMEARSRGSSPWENAKRALIDFVDELAAANSDDSLTLVLASRPHHPVFNGLPIDDAAAVEIADTIKELTVSDMPAAFDTALLAIEKTSDRRAAGVNRVVYVVSDLRRRDWAAQQPAESDDPADESQAVAATLQRVARQATGCFLVDAAEEDAAAENVGNLAVTQIVPHEKALAAGVASRFEVIVENMGTRDVNQVAVKFTAADSMALRGRIDHIEAGGTASLPFTYTFARPEDPLEDTALNHTPLQPVPIEAQISVEDSPGADLLAADNVRYFAARIVPGLPTLIVDGDPSATYGRSESFFVQRALSPPGEFLSGVAVTVVSDADLETVRLADYQVIYLCNVYRLSQPCRDALEAWVAAGGGLIVALGDRIDEQFYNEQLYRDGEGPLPLRLERIDGDETETSWASLDTDSRRHPVLGIFEGEGSPLIQRVKVFRWWRGSLSEQSLQEGTVTRAARLTDDDQSPAVVEKVFGDGRVLVLTTAVDADWSSWPEDPSYLIAMQEFSRYMARATGDKGSILVGEPLHRSVDLTKYRTDVSVSGPGSEAATIQSTPDPNHENGANQSIWAASYDKTMRRGFYRMALRRTDGEPETTLFAVNMDPTEGDLKRVDRQILRRDLADAPVEIVAGDGLAELATEGAKGELWVYALWALVIVLCAEQSLAWLFGLRR